MDILENDIVRLNIDLPENGLRKGDVGVVLMIYTSPRKAFCVEFDQNNNVMVDVEPNQVEPVLTYSDRHKVAS